ncbi:MAG: PolC-type DNA polymerase III [Oscillospiraceae bacterium]|nr:PolC-type DNA polymerase III [Oscillospiraceae bacterium]
MDRITPFLELFRCCEPLRSHCGGLDQALVSSVTINRERLSMNADVRFAAAPSAQELLELEACIATEYGLHSVALLSPSDVPEPAAEPVPVKPKKKRSVPKEETVSDSVLFGKDFKPAPLTEIGNLTRESGPVVIRGEIFSVENRDIKKTKAVVLDFCITDYTGSIRVSKYISSGKDRSVTDRIKPGMYVAVKGTATYNRYDEDLVVDPQAIILAKKPVRMDDYPGDKRVELHLHTRFSTLDALSDPVAVVETASRWGHPAVAFTDHGVVQAFPDAWNAAKKKGIKVIYGLEGYFINDVDDRLAVHGHDGRALTDEFVAFDLETTGLHQNRDRIIEIGAVIFRGTECIARFDTFVNPGRALPREITDLTGITERDVFDAPSEAEAIPRFLEFVGDRPLIAHNADFDVGFVQAACERLGLPFTPVYADTLALAQTLLPDLKRYKLDMVAGRLGLPDFRHHRADDDAYICGRICERFFAMLAEKGVRSFDGIQQVISGMGSGLGGHRARHIVLLAKNKAGLKNLYELVSKSHLEYFHRHPLIPKSLLQQYRDGLIIGSACQAGEVFDAILGRRSAAEQRRLAAFYDYLEIQPICNNEFLIPAGRVSGEEELRDLNRRIVELASELGKPVVATGDVHFLEPEQEIFRRILLASKKMDDADRPTPLYFKTTSEMLEEFSYLGEAKAKEVVIDASRAIADQIESFDILPKDLYPPKIENSAEDLQRLCYEKLHALYGDDPPAIVTERMETELHDILMRKYDVIYMSAQKLVSDSLAHGYLVGSRGSVGSSLVAYMSGITEVNALPAHYRCPNCRYSDFESGKGYGCGADMPDKLCPVCGTLLDKDGFDIPFETFLGFGGDKVPDIDLNFSGEYQANAHKYTETLFGRDHVFKAGTIGTLAEKTAYGYVKKYLEERGLTVTKAEENRLAAGCVGVKRTTGQHPGGLVIIPQDMDVTDFCPVQHPADDRDSDIITTHFDYHKMEANLLKLDELGHDDPTMIRMLEDLTGLDAKKIRLDDKQTMGIFRSPEPLGLPDDDPIIGKTGTIGIPEFGTGFTRQMLVDTKPEHFDILIRLSGFSHGTDVWLGNAKDLIMSGTASVKDTVGCRDDIMLYLISVGMEPKRAFKFMEAVRKGAIHKGKPWPDGIVEEMQSLGVPEWYIESCRRIQYLFPKAHAVAYVMMAFRIAWFKVHEPLAFYSAYFYRRSQKDSFDADLMLGGVDKVRAAINDIQRNPAPTAKEEDLLTTLEAVYEFYMRGFSFLGIDLYRSDAAKFLIEDGSLRPPFVAISGLGEAAAQDLMNCRTSGNGFISVEELSKACPKVSQTHLETLKAMGALGDLPEENQISFFDGF